MPGVGTVSAACVIVCGCSHILWDFFPTTRVVNTNGALTGHISS